MTASVYDTRFPSEKILYLSKHIIYRHLTNAQSLDLFTHLLKIKMLFGFHVLRIVKICENFQRAIFETTW